MASFVVVLRDNLHWLDCERFRAVLREHGHNNIVHNLQFCSVGSSHLNEDVGGVQRDLRVVAVDDRRHRADNPLRVVDDWVYWLIPNDVKVLPEMLVILVELHHLLGIHLLGLVQRLEFDVLWW